MDLVSYEINGKKANTKWQLNLLEKLTILGGGIWIWKDFEYIYFMYKKMFAVKKFIEKVKELTWEFPESKLEIVDLSEEVLDKYLKMAKRRRDKGDVIIDKKTFSSELNCCKEIGNMFYGMKEYQMALICYIHFFITNKSNKGFWCSREEAPTASDHVNGALLFIDNNQTTIRRMNAIGMAKLCNNISVCFFYQQKYDQSLQWCQCALLFNDKYEKVIRRITHIKHLLENDVD